MRYFLNTTFYAARDRRRGVGDGASFLEWLVSAELLDGPAAAKLKHLFGTKARSPATEHPRAINRNAGSRHTSRTDCLEGNVDVTARGVRIRADFLVRFFG